MKKIFITLTVIILAVGGAYFVFERKSPRGADEAKACDSYQKQSEKDTCLFELAIRTGDKKYCKDIKDETLRLACDSGSATSTALLFGGLNSSPSGTSASSAMSSSGVSPTRPSVFTIPTSYKMRLVALNELYAPLAVLTSSDAGSTWQKVASEPDDLYFGPDGIASMSADGKSLVYAGGGYIGGSYTYLSSDGGKSWSYMEYDRESDRWSSVDMSADGRVRTLVSSADQNEGFIGDIWEYVKIGAPDSFPFYRFSDTQAETKKHSWTSVGISPDGMYELASYFDDRNGDTDCGLYLQYGASDWQKIGNRLDGKLFGNTPCGPTMPDEGSGSKGIALSADGKYMVVTGRGGGSLVIVSQDYGEHWTTRATNVRNRKSGGSVAVSWDGKYMAVTATGESSGIRGTSTYGGELIVSEDFGVTWQKSATFPGTSWLGRVFISPDGRQWVVTTQNTDMSSEDEAAFYVSLDYGETWAKKTVSYQDEYGEMSYVEPEFLLVGWQVQ